MSYRSSLPTTPDRQPILQRAIHTRYLSIRCCKWARRAFAVFAEADAARVYPARGGTRTRSEGTRDLSECCSAERAADIAVSHLVQLNQNSCNFSHLNKLYMHMMQHAPRSHMIMIIIPC